MSINQSMISLASIAHTSLASPEVSLSGPGPGGSAVPPLSQMLGVENGSESTAESWESTFVATAVSEMHLIVVYTALALLLNGVVLASILVQIRASLHTGSGPNSHGSHSLGSQCRLAANSAHQRQYQQPYSHGQRQHHNSVSSLNSNNPTLNTAGSGSRTTATRTGSSKSDGSAIKNGKSGGPSFTLNSQPFPGSAPAPRPNPKSGCSSSLKQASHSINYYQSVRNCQVPVIDILLAILTFSAIVRVVLKNTLQIACWNGIVCLVNDGFSCSALGFANTFIQLFTFWLMALLAQDRYVKHYAEHDYISKCSHLVLYITLSCIFFMLSMHLFGPIYGFSNYRFRSDELSCSVDWSERFSCAYFIYTFILAAAPAVLPLTYWSVKMIASELIKCWLAVSTRLQCHRLRCCFRGRRHTYQAPSTGARHYSPAMSEHRCSCKCPPSRPFEKHLSAEMPIKVSSCCGACNEELCRTNPTAPPPDSKSVQTSSHSTLRVAAESDLQHEHVDNKSVNSFMIHKSDRRPRDRSETNADIASIQNESSTVIAQKGTPTRSGSQACNDVSSPANCANKFVIVDLTVLQTHCEENSRTECRCKRQHDCPCEHSHNTINGASSQQNIHAEQRQRTLCQTTPFSAVINEHSDMQRSVPNTPTIITAQTDTRPSQQQQQQQQRQRPQRKAGAERTVASSTVGPQQRIVRLLGSSLHCLPFSFLRSSSKCRENCPRNCSASGRLLNTFERKDGVNRLVSCKFDNNLRDANLFELESIVSAEGGDFQDGSGKTASQQKCDYCREGAATCCALKRTPGTIKQRLLRRVFRRETTNGCASNDRASNQNSMISGTTSVSMSSRFRSSSSTILARSLVLSESNETLTVALACLLFLLSAAPKFVANGCEACFTANERNVILKFLTNSFNFWAPSRDHVLADDKSAVLFSTRPTMLNNDLEGTHNNDTFAVKSDFFRNTIDYSIFNDSGPCLLVPLCVLLCAPKSRIVLPHAWRFLLTLLQTLRLKPESSSIGHSNYSCRCSCSSLNQASCSSRLGCFWMGRRTTTSSGTNASTGTKRLGSLLSRCQNAVRSNHSNRTEGQQSQTRNNGARLEADHSKTAIHEASVDCLNSNHDSVCDLNNNHNRVRVDEPEQSAVFVTLTGDKSADEANKAGRSGGPNRKRSKTKLKRSLSENDYSPAGEDSRSRNRTKIVKRITWHCPNADNYRTEPVLAANIQSQSQSFCDSVSRRIWNKAEFSV